MIRECVAATGEKWLVSSCMTSYCDVELACDLARVSTFEFVRVKDNYES